MRVVEFCGGLGDIFTDIFNSDVYTQLETLKNGEKAQVVLRSANPGIRDLFRWHPMAPQIEIVDIGSGDPWGPEQRKQFGIGEPTHRGSRNGTPVNFYPSPEDLSLLGRIPKPYIVFAISAGAPSVNIPLSIAEKAAEIATEKKLTVVTVGRSYANILRNFTNNSQNILNREESRLKVRLGIIDTIDQLSVPGLALLVKGSAATLCCHSSLMSISWHFRRPMFSLYHEMKRREWTEKAGTTWGRDFEETKSICLNDWDPKLFYSFLDSIRPVQLPFAPTTKASEKVIFVEAKCEDLLGLSEALRRASFLLRNVGSDCHGTYVYLDIAEQKDPRSIVESFALS